MRSDAKQSDVMCSVLANTCLAGLVKKLSRVSGMHGSSGGLIKRNHTMKQCSEGRGKREEFRSYPPELGYIIWDLTKRPHGLDMEVRLSLEGAAETREKKEAVEGDQ